MFGTPEQAAAFRAACKRDPLLFARKVWGRKRWEGQRRIRQALATFSLVVIFGGNGIGKTSELAAYIIEDVVLNPGTRWTLAGPKFKAIKKNIGSAFPGSEVKEMEVKGRNLSEGVPRSFTISSNEILEALTDPLNQMVSSVKNALEQTPPELGADIAERGMMLTGGGALLRDLDRLLSEETGLPVLVAEDPLTCVVRGCGIALERMERLPTIFTSE